MQATANVTDRTTDWNSVNWRKANKIVKNLRYRIFRATQEGNWKRVRNLQKLLMKSYSNVLLAVRRVTQQNQGKRTAGVDKVLVKTPKARGELVDQLSSHRPWKPLPARRVYIPKKDGKKRPLGIPVIRDRCLQAMVKNALEPCWEAQFETNSYGFRPGRNTHDAMERIFIYVRPTSKKKWVLDADIKGCFDNIAHEPLMETIGNFPARKTIAQWLKAGVMEEGRFLDTLNGTPQGGVISPLLANIALHGMEKAVETTEYRKGKSRNQRALVRYADDSVILCETKEEAQNAKETIQSWLKPKGLELSSEKTKIVHISEGFNFLGFNVRQYAKKGSTRTGWKLLIKPSKESVKKLRHKLKGEWRQLVSQSPELVIRKLNPIIRGWANYFRTQVSGEIFSQIDYWMGSRAYRYTRFRHPRKPWKWRKPRYFGAFNPERPEARRVFGCRKTGRYLLRFGWFKIKRHILVKGSSSPDDPALKDYWKMRYDSRSKDLSNKSTLKIARQQSHVCNICGESLYNGEELHKHHKEPKSKGGKDAYDNLELVHIYCHQHIHGSHE